MPTVEVKNLETVGAVVRLLQEASGQTQAQAAAELNISRAYLIEIEKGTQTFYIKRLFRVLGKYRIRVHITYELPGEGHE